MANRQEAQEQYNRSLKLGQKNYKEQVVRGNYPYPQVLDEILDENMVAGRADMGVLEIPTEQIIGTKTAGRRSAASTVWRSSTATTAVPSCGTWSAGCTAGTPGSSAWR